MKLKNWAGNLSFEPEKVLFPETEDEIQRLVLMCINEGKKIRVIGSGHSFSALIETNQMLINLINYQGLVSINKDLCQATLKGGTVLKNAGEILFQNGLAMENLGDIDSQSIAGTISTGTHGTGIGFGTISTQVVGLKFINGKGEIIYCSATVNSALFKAAQVSLGLLGIIIEVTLQCVPSYKLLVKNRKEPLDKVLASIDQRNAENRNFEFFWMPFTNTVWSKSSNIALQGEPDKDNFVNYLSELLIENYSFKALCEWARFFPSQNKAVSKIVARTIPNIDKLNYSHKVYATMRIVKFEEMEYNIPAEAYQDVMSEIVKICNSGVFDVHFPIESRWVKGDDIYMSPAYGRDSAYIACHVYYKKDSKKYFEKLESIFQAYGGRPHWGKLNSISKNIISEIYPEFKTFQKYRKEHDPENMFMSTYMESIFGY